MNFFKNRPLAICCSVFVSVFFVSFYIPPSVKLILIIGALAVGVLFFKKRMFVSVVSLAVIMSAVYGYLYFDQYVTKASRLPEAGNERIEIVDISFSNDKIAYVDGIDQNGYKIHYTIYGVPEIELGDVIAGEITFKEIQPSDDFDVERFYNSRNIWIEGEVNGASVVGHNGSFVRKMIAAAHNYCKACFDDHTNDTISGVLSALAIGERSELDDSIRRDFGRAGLSHMLAISGMHLSVIMGCIVMFADMFRLDKRWSSVIVIVICACYILVAGASSSILRAGIMFILMSLSSVFRRQSDSLTNLMVSVTLIILFSPSAVFDTGLILSFTATLGIVVIVGKYMRRTRDVKHTLLGKLWHGILISFITTLSAHAFSFIPMLIFFDNFSIISILSNLLVSPVITVVLFVIPVLLVISKLPFVAGAIGYILDILTSLMIWLVGKLASIPDCLVDLGYSFVPYTLIAIAFGVAFIFVFKKRNAYIMPYLCWLVAFTVSLSVYNLFLVDKYDVVMYSEASSDAVIMRNSYGTVYIDLGKGSGASEERAFKVINKELYTEELDCWVIVEYSNNIVRYANDYMNEYYIRNLYLPVPYDSVSEAAAAELEYYAEQENVVIHYYDYGCCFVINNADICIYEPVRFEDSDVFIPSANIKLGTREISYVGCGYFDYRDPHDEYDVLYVGECGTKRKQKTSPDIDCTASYIAENNGIASKNIGNKKHVFSDEDSSVKMRLSR